MTQKKNFNRRRFLKRAASAAVGTIGFGLGPRTAATFPQGGVCPYITSSSAPGKTGSIAPSNRITLGFVGLGQHGTRVNLRNFLGNSDAQVVAVCDVNREGSAGYYSNGRVLGREPAKRIVETHYTRESQSGTYKGCYTTADWQEVVARDDIDAVVASITIGHGRPVTDDGSLPGG